MKKKNVSYFSDITPYPYTDYRRWIRYHAFKMKETQVITGYKMFNDEILKEYLIKKKGGQIRLHLTEDYEKEVIKKNEMLQLNLF